MESKTASAPGKVLLTGGYLVLDRQYTGLVFGLDARIHVHVATATIDPPARYVVVSPQFRETEWRYNETVLPDGAGTRLSQVQDNTRALSSRNPFVQTALEFALTYIRYTGIEPTAPLKINVLADESYYSQSDDATTDPSGGRGRFKDFGVSLAEAHKTGLGSSAALVTSLTAALLAFFLGSIISQLSEEEKQSRLHNLSQATHCAAQGKIGSGFDVAAAVYGSCSYRRFSPSILDELGSVGSRDFDQRLAQIVENTQKGQKWDNEVHREAAVIPKGLRLVMCDVDCGSQTVGMVKKVLAWRATDSLAAEQLWTRLDQHNSQLGRLFEAAAIGKIDNDCLAAAIQEIRSDIQSMSKAAGVPIEPESQTNLLDTCTSIPGVLGGVVPGAGGDDAIVLLAEDKAEVLEAIRKLISSWRIDRSASGMKEGRVKILNIREEKLGIQYEDPNGYKPWI